MSILSAKDKYLGFCGWVVFLSVIFFCQGYIFAQGTTDLPANPTLKTIERLAKDLPENVGDKGNKPDAEVDKLNLRPSIEFAIDTKKQSFNDYYKQKKREKKGPVVVEGTFEPGTQDEETVKLPPFVINGLVWGTAVPQAIINGKVLKIGDTIEEVRIVTIDKTGVGVLFEGKPVKVASPSKSYFMNDSITVSEGGEKDE